MVALNYTLLITHSFFNIEAFVISYVLDTMLEKILKSPLYVFSQFDHNIFLKRNLIVFI